MFSIVNLKTGDCYFVKANPWGDTTKNFFTYSRKDGLILSVQADGSINWLSAGPFLNVQIFKVVGNLAVIQPLAGNNTYVFGIVDSNNMPL